MPQIIYDMLAHEAANITLFRQTNDEFYRDEARSLRAQINASYYETPTTLRAVC
jgi:hypothetical protein